MPRKLCNSRIVGKQALDAIGRQTHALPVAAALTLPAAQQAHIARTAKGGARRQGLRQRRCIGQTHIQALPRQRVHAVRRVAQ